MRINHVLATTDLGSTSAAALHYASALAKAFGSDLHILHVVEGAHGRLVTVEPVGRYLLNPNGQWVRGAEVPLHRLVIDLDPARTREVVRHGHAADQILAYAAESHADLIVVGMHGSGRRPPFLGSVAQRVQLGAACPVLLVPGVGHTVQDAASSEPGSGVDRSVPRIVLVPTDFSQRSSVALALGCYFGRSLNAAVHLLHVMDPPRHLAYVPPVAESDEELRRRVQRRLDIEVERQGDQDVAVWSAVRFGDPAAEILHCAAELGADLIIMGTHGRPVLQRLVLGSVAQSIMRRASCPLLTVCASHVGRVDETRSSSEGGRRTGRRAEEHCPIPTTGRGTACRSEVEGGGDSRVHAAQRIAMDYRDAMGASCRDVDSPDGR